MNKYKFSRFSLAMLTVNFLLLAALTHLIMKAVNNKDDLTEDYWTTGVYNQCIISEPNEIVSIKIQDSLDNIGKQKFTFYGFNKMSYPATLNVDFLEGVMFSVKLNNQIDALLTIDYRNHTCGLSMYDNSSNDLKPIYDKSGYLGSSIDNKDTDDFYYKLHKEHDLKNKKN